MSRKLNWQHLVGCSITWLVCADITAEKLLTVKLALVNNKYVQFKKTNSVVVRLSSNYWFTMLAVDLKLQLCSGLH